MLSSFRTLRISRIFPQALLLFLLLSDWTLARPCKTLTTHKVSRTLPCQKAVQEMFLQAWQLDVNLTASLNNWKNDLGAILKNAFNGALGNCVIFKIQPFEECCAGYAGVNCDTEPKKDSYQYCFAQKNCDGEDIFNGTLVLAQKCCDDETRSWGKTGEGNYCLDCIYVKNPTQRQKHAVVPLRSCRVGALCTVKTFAGFVHEPCTSCEVTLLELGTIKIDSWTTCNTVSLCFKVIRILDESNDRIYELLEDSVIMRSVNESYPLKSILLSDLSEHVEKIGDLNFDAVGDSVFLVFPVLNLAVRRDNGVEILITIGIGSNLLNFKYIGGACQSPDQSDNKEISFISQLNVDTSNWNKTSSKAPCVETIYPCKSSNEEQEALNACSILSTDLFSPCHSKVDVRPYVKYCQQTYCSMPAGSLGDIRCQAIGAYASTCLMERIEISWRDTSKCGKTCSSNMEYRDCGPSFRPACGRPHDTGHLLKEQETCVSGCHCPDGLLYDNKTCVPPHECHCTHNGESYDQNEEMHLLDNCQNCTCGPSGLWNCSTSANCYASCSVYGPGALTTFDRSEFVLASDQAECIYTLVAHPKNSLTIKLISQKSLQDPTILLSKGVEIQADRVHFVVQFLAHSQYEVLDLRNNQSVRLPYTDEYLYIRTPTSSSIAIDAFNFRILLFSLNYLMVSTWESLHEAGTLRGLCGNMNRLVGDDRILPSGIDAESDNTFIGAYSVESCGQSGDSHQINRYNINDKVPNLKFYMENIFLTKLPVNNLDGIALGSKDLIAAQSTILKMSHAMQIPMTSIVDRLSKFVQLPDIKEMRTCQGDLKYNDRVKVWSSQCLDLQLPVRIFTDKTVPGCACPTGHLLSQDGRCLPRSRCPCYDDKSKLFFKPGPFMNGSCYSCNCQDGRLSCVYKGCEKIVCPKNQEEYKYTPTSNGVCARHKCPDKFSVGISCADDAAAKGKCVCQEGFVETTSGLCVPTGTCPCFFNDKWYEHGSEITVKCCLKRCNNSIWKTISRTECQATCYIAGTLMRIVTFDGSVYRFPGHCSYTLVKSVESVPEIKVSIKNLACGSSGFACSHKIDIQYQDQLVQLIKGVGVMIGNETYPMDESARVGDLKIFSSTLYSVISFDDISVYWSGGLFTRIQVSDRWVNKLEGLCGTYDFDSKNDMQKSDRSLDSNVIQFGMSWKEEGATCSDSDYDIVTPACQKHQERALWARSMCSVIMTSEAFQACRMMMPQMNINRFVSDCEENACTCDRGGDCECLCDSISHFAATCSALGFPTKWRHQHLCPVQCDGGMVYQSKGTLCQRTCTDVARNATAPCSENIKVEGCFCPPGQVLHDSMCILQSECPCDDGTMQYPHGANIAKNCMNCTCMGGVLNCTGRNEFLCKENGLCIPKDKVCNHLLDCPGGSDEQQDVCGVTESSTSPIFTFTTSKPTTYRPIERNESIINGTGQSIRTDPTVISVGTTSQTTQNPVKNTSWQTTHVTEITTSNKTSPTKPVTKYSSSPEISQTTPVTENTKPMTESTTPNETSQTTPVTGSTTPVTEYTTPVTESTIPNETSQTTPVTEYTTPVTEYTTPVTESTIPNETSQTTPVTEYTTPVTEYTTPVTESTTPNETSQTTPVTEYTTPVTEYTTPVTESTIPNETSQTTPLTEYTTPVTEYTSPVTESTIPNETSQTTPVTESTTPVTEYTTPVTESTIPNETSQTTPVTEYTTPVTEYTTPVTESTTPNETSQTTPVTEYTTPVTEYTTPVTESTIPNETSQTTPLTEYTTPVTEYTSPVTESTIPNETSQTTPVTESTTPVTEYTTPVTESTIPNETSQTTPLTEYTTPVTEYTSPVTESTIPNETSQTTPVTEYTSHVTEYTTPNETSQTTPVTEYTTPVTEPTTPNETSQTTPVTEYTSPVTEYTAPNETSQTTPVTEYTTRVTEPTTPNETSQTTPVTEYTTHVTQSSIPNETSQTTPETEYTSAVTEPKTPNETSQTTLVTEYTTPVTQSSKTNETSQTTLVTEYTSAVTESTTPNETSQTTPMTEYTSAVTEPTTPIETSQTTPVTEYTTHNETLQKTPVTENTTPNETSQTTPNETLQTTPVNEYTSPVTESTTHNETSQRIPVTEYTTLITEYTTPNEISKTTPVTEYTTPNETSQTTPVTEYTTPVTEYTTPNETSQTTHVTENVTPNETSQITPVIENTKPVTEYTTPVTESTTTNEISQRTPVTEFTTSNETSQTTHVTENTTPNETSQKTPVIENTTHLTESTIPNETSQTTPVTEYTKAVTEYTTPVTESTTPNETSQTTHVTEYTIHVTESTTPKKTSQTTPGTEYTSPVTESTTTNEISQTTPVTEYTTSNETSQTTHVTENTTPNETSQITPVIENTKPVTEYTTPVTESTTPNETSQTTPVTEYTKPVTEYTTPVTESTTHNETSQTTPVIENITQVTESTTPNETPQTTPVTEYTIPVTESTTPKETSQTTHVIEYTIPVPESSTPKETSQTTPVTEYTSPVTESTTHNETSQRTPVTEYTTLITEYTTPNEISQTTTVNEYTTPNETSQTTHVTDYTTPNETLQTTPVTENTTPVTEFTTPNETSQRTPVTEYATPAVTEYRTPNETSQTTPVTEFTTPNETSPVTESTTHLTESTTPVTESTTPNETSQTAPVTEYTTPVTESTTPNETSQRTPVTEYTSHVTESTTPNETSQKTPVTEYTTPVTEYTAPLETSQTIPVTEYTSPATEYTTANETSPTTPVTEYTTLVTESTAPYETSPTTPVMEYTTANETSPTLPVTEFTTANKTSPTTPVTEYTTPVTESTTPNETSPTTTVVTQETSVVTDMTTSVLPDTCPLPSMYTSCLVHCEQSCRRFRTEKACQLGEKCVPGCLCPPEQLANEDELCIPKEQCPCYDTSGYQKPHNSTYIDDTTCQTCFCDDKGSTCHELKSVPAELDSLFDVGHWSNWSDCSALCGSGTSTRHRFRSFMECTVREVETQTCNATRCICVTPDGQVIGEGETSRAMENCTQCTCQNGQLDCKVDSNIVPEIEIWNEWGNWSPCVQNCTDYHQSRCRTCKMARCGNLTCQDGECETKPCGKQPCCDIYQWAEWTDCDVACRFNGSGVRTRQRRYQDSQTESACPRELQTRNCSSCKCSEKIGQWSEWTSCSADTCGWGKRSRKRFVPTSCQTIPDNQSEDCFVKPCDCPDGLIWSNHSLYQRSCLSEPPPDSRLQVSGGCVCPSHLVFDGRRCIKLKDCQLDCTYNNQTIKVGESLPCENCETCHCQRGQIIKTKRVCTDVRKCDLTTHQLVPSKDECCMVDCVPMKRCQVLRQEPSNVTIDNCTSTVPIRQELCTGQCPAASMFVDYVHKTLAQSKCTCCIARVTHWLPIRFRCPDSFELTHRIPVIDSCFCQTCFVDINNVSTAIN